MKTQSIIKPLACALFAILFIASYNVLADAAVYYVATTGSDTNAGTLSLPWRTPSKAWQMASAGDTVYFRAGTYTINSKVTAANNGTSSSPITFKNYTGELVTFDASGSAIIPFEILRTYHVFDGFTIMSQGTGVWFGGWGDGDASGGVVQNCTFIMTVGYSDNAGAIMAGGDPSYTNFTFQNNTITGPGTGTNSNVAGIWIDYISNWKIKNNVISGFPQCFYSKHADSVAQTGNEISYNYMYGCNVGIGDVHNYVLIQHNIINAIALAIRGGNDGGGGSGCKYLTMNHNTLIGVDNPDGGAIQFEYQGGGVGGCDYFSTNNNIFIARANYEPYSSAQSSPDIVSTMVASDYNLYPSSTAVTHNSTNYSLPSSKSLTSKDGHALSGAPTFTGGSSPSTIAGYALTSGSVGHNAASDGTDMGANVSLVGSGSGQRTVAPSSPNLF